VSKDQFDYGIDLLGRMRFFGLYRGVVVDIDDPLGKERIRVKVPQVLGTEISGWAEACVPLNALTTHTKHAAHSAIITTSGGGSPSHSHSVSVNLTHDNHSAHTTVPAVDEGVWIMFEAGDPDFPVWMGVFA
jgi:hypothetical protein